VRTETFVDTSRPTDANGSYPGAPSRTLATTVWYPAEGTPGGPDQPDAPAYDDRRFPLLIFAHGFNADGDVVVTSVLHFLDRYLKHRGGSIHALLEDGNVPGVARLDQAR
jgi:hypothetical protein